MFDKPIDYIALVGFVLVTYFLIVFIVKIGSIPDADDLRIEIMKRQKNLGIRVFDTFDFKKYSYSDLKKLNEELKDLQRFQKVRRGEFRWFEILKPSKKIDKLPQKRENYLVSDLVYNVSLPLNWDLRLLNDNKDVHTLQKERIEEGDYLRYRLNDYFMDCFGKNIIKTFDAKITWEEVEFFVEFVIDGGSIDGESLEKELNVLLDRTVNVGVSGNTIIITVPTNKKGYPTTFLAFSKFARDSKPKSLLTAMAGVTREGEVVEYDLLATEGALISGSCSTGKTTLVKQLVASIMLTAKSDEVKFLFFDGHKIEYDMFEGSSYLYKSIKRDEKEVFDALKDLETESQRRFELLLNGGFGNIGELNSRVPDAERLPYIVVVIDYKELFLENRREDKEKLLTELVDKGRMLGIIYILVCQSLDPKIIPRSLKNSFGLTLTFKHNSMLESFHAIGSPNATHLPTKGVCLADLNNNPEFIRVYTTNVTDKEMERIVESASRV
jgi:hypothetical protein